MTKPNVSFKSWSQTRLSDYDQCPFMAMHKHLLKTCPFCFKGPVKGGYETPAICSSCGKEIVKGDALVRGAAVGVTLEKYVNGTGKKLHPEIKHPKVLALAKEFRALHTKAKVAVEQQFNLDRNWNVLPPRWSPDVWLIVKMDVLRHVSAKEGRIVDWKTGGIEKRGPRAGKPYDNEAYAEQLKIYSVAGLCVFPQWLATTAALCFVDAAKEYDPVVERPEGSVVRPELAKAKKALEARVLPLFKDTTFAPRANQKCTYCPFQKGKGGPCPY